jgi:hypothetical protein
VDGCGVEDGFGVDGGVDEGVEPYCELIYMLAVEKFGYEMGRTYQGTGDVDASSSGVGAVQPLRLGESEEAIR